MPPWLEKAMILEPFMELEHAAASRLAKLNVADAAAAEARRRRNSGMSHHSALMLFAAETYGINDAVASAAGAYEEVIANADDPWDEYSARCLLGQLRLSSSPQTARVEFQSLATALENRGLGGGFDGLYKGAMLGLAESERSSGQLADAVGTRQLLLERLGDALTQRTVAYICIENGRDLYNAGRIAEGRSWWDQLVRRCPEFGRDDGTIIGYRLEAARRGGAIHNGSPEYIAELRALWADPNLSGMPRSLLVGSNLVTAIRSANAPMDQREADALAVNIDMLDRYFTSEVAWSEALARTPEPFGESHRRAMNEILRSTLADVATSGARFGHADWAVVAADEFLATHANDAMASEVIGAREKAAAALAGR